jgi:predicted small metal-binding protein
MPLFKCKDIGMNDTFEVYDVDQDELMKIVELHIQNSHNIKEILPEMMDKIKESVKTNDNCGATCQDFG